MLPHLKPPLEASALTDGYTEHARCVGTGHVGVGLLQTTSNFVSENKRNSNLDLNFSKMKTEL